MKPKFESSLSVEMDTKNGGLMVLKLPTTLFYPYGEIEAPLSWNFKEVPAERTFTL